MKKTIITLPALCISVFCSAQLKTTSTYDVDGNGSVNIGDISSTVEKVLGKTADNRQVVDAETLNSVLKSIDARLNAIETKLGVGGFEEGKIFDTHEYVDLGLPSGTLWATCNVGANSPEEFGDYYAWGETETKTNYNLSTYKYYASSTEQDADGFYIITKGYTKYNPQSKSSDNGYKKFYDDKTKLEPDDDVAHVLWGGDWRMPTKAEQDELRNNCIWGWTELKGVNGYKVTGVNGKYIFLPAAGYRDNSSLSVEGSRGYYWSNSLIESSPDCAFYLDFYSSRVNWSGYYRSYGYSVRPVRHQ
ncbi:MAG: hypothetical protein MJZ41_06950 [Bacteroidaceae bacterium]|nr:hypothetical protein [Bacteroidaceae bacterium]